MTYDSALRIRARGRARDLRPAGWDCGRRGLGRRRRASARGDRGDRSGRDERRPRGRILACRDPVPARRRHRPCGRAGRPPHRLRVGATRKRGDLCRGRPLGRGATADPQFPIRPSSLLGAGRSPDRVAERGDGLCGPRGGTCRRSRPPDARPRPWRRRRAGVVAGRLEDRLLVESRRPAPAVGRRCDRRRGGASRRDAGARLRARVVTGRRATRVRARVRRGLRSLDARPLGREHAQAHPWCRARLASGLGATRRQDRVRPRRSGPHVDLGRRHGRSARPADRGNGRPVGSRLGANTARARAPARRAPPRSRPACTGGARRRPGGQDVPARLRLVHGESRPRSTRDPRRSARGRTDDRRPGRRAPRRCHSGRS